MISSLLSSLRLISPPVTGEGGAGVFVLRFKLLKSITLVYKYRSIEKESSCSTLGSEPAAQLGPPQKAVYVHTGEEIQVEPSVDAGRGTRRRVRAGER